MQRKAWSSVLDQRYAAMARDLDEGEAVGGAAPPGDDDLLWDPDRIDDDVLALVFTACHPVLSRELLEDSHLLPSVRGELLTRLGRHHQARAELEVALDRCTSDHERRLLESKLKTLA